MHTGPVSWLTSRRLRAQGIALAICLWGVYFWILATPGLRDRNGNLKGTDFLHFYTLGKLAIENRGADLYNMSAQAAVAAQQVPQAAGLRYLPLYPPQVSLLFIPFAHLPYAWALALWWSCTTAIYGVCCYFIWRACCNLRPHPGLTVVLAAAFPAFFNLIAWGQTSALALACFTAMFFLLQDKRDFLAGLAFGCLIFKPQLALAGAIIFLSGAAGKVLLGALISSAIQLGAGVLYYGMGPVRAWIHMLLRVREVFPLLEPRPYQTHSLRSFWDLLLPTQIALPLYVLSALLVLALAIACWRRASQPLSLRYSALLIASVLIAPHLTVYDLVILAPAFLLLADWLAGQCENVHKARFVALLYLAYVLPFLAPVTRWTHVQLSVLAMLGILYCLWEAVRQPDAVITQDHVNA
jgi:hypothetical protein